MAELFDGFNSRVRMLLGTNETLVTDAMLESFEFSGMATKYIDSLVTKTDLSETEIELKNSCYVYQTALYILPTLQSNSIKVKQTTNAKIEYSQNTKQNLTETIKDRLCQCLISLDVSFATSINNFSISNEDTGYGGSYFHI